MRLRAHRGPEGVDIMPELVSHRSTTSRRRIEALERELGAARQKIDELEARIETDPLLNILNRRGFERELRRALVYANRYHASVAVQFIDLDQFKAINDRHSRLAGDAALSAVSEAIVRSHRASDIVARFGGDEFALLLWNLSETDAQAKARSIENVISSLQISFSTKTFSVSASAGVTMLRRFDCLERVIARAYQDVYARKRQRASAAAALSASLMATKQHKIA
jgi:diguanylate cyclase (GGDEF)-like protein